MFHSDMKAGVPHRTGEQLVDAFPGQAGDGQVDLLGASEVDGIAAGKLRLLQNLNQIGESFLTSPLAAVSGSDTDGGKGVIG